MNWLPAYFLFLGMGFQLLCYCVAGTFAEMTVTFLLFQFAFNKKMISFQNDFIYKTIIQSKWYLLPQSEKKSIIVMIAMTQNPKLLDVGGLYPLNVNLFVSVMLHNRILFSNFIYLIVFFFLDNENNLFVHNDVTAIYGLKLQKKTHSN